MHAHSSTPSTLLCLPLLHAVPPVPLSAVLCRTGRRMHRHSTVTPIPMHDPAHGTRHGARTYGRPGTLVRLAIRGYAPRIALYPANLGPVAVRLGVSRGPARRPADHRRDVHRAISVVLCCRQYPPSPRSQRLSHDFWSVSNHTLNDQATACTGNRNDSAFLAPSLTPDSC